MEGILHFPGQRRLSTKLRHFTVQPTLSECEISEEERYNLSPLIKKKSHFATKEEKCSSLALHECEFIDEESHTPLSLCLDKII